MAKVVGIDLGTTNSLVAIAGPSGPEVLRDREGEGTLQSLVGALPNGELVVGREAAKLLTERPSDVAYSVKRLMGRSVGDVADLLPRLPPITAVLDLACGLNPLAIPWMGLSPGAIYHACDIDRDQMAFLAAAMPLFGVSGDAFVCNLLADAPRVSADVALLLKTIPCLEQADKGIGPRLLEAIHAPVVIVSFPARSLGGRSKGMAVNYAAHFAQLSQGKAWRIERFDFQGELVFRVVK